MNIQVKKIAFTTLLLFAANTWAAEELPIELTCEIGHLIVYYHITGSTDTTEYMTVKRSSVLLTVSAAFFLTENQNKSVSRTAQNATT